MTLFENQTIQKLRQDVRQKAREEGACCPVCDQFVKVYRRRITSTMAAQLIDAYRQFGALQWFHVSDLENPHTGDFAKLRFWGLIEKKEHNPGDKGKRTSGQWRITIKGEKFADDNEIVPEFALVYNGDLLTLDGSLVGIKRALGKKFDYNDLMQPV